MNRVIRRLDMLESSAVDDRHARVDDLALLVDLIAAGWKSVDERLARVEDVVGRIEHTLEHREGAIVYRIEEQRADMASGA